MKKFTLRIISICMFLLMGTYVMAQIPEAITISPDNATAFDEITLTLDASLTCPDSALFNADSVMMHSGITIDGAAWQNVVAFDALGANGQQPKLVYAGPYTPPAISITPANATAWDEITLTLDAKLSCPDSALFNADSVMMHSGITIDSSASQNVVAFDALGANGQQPKLISNGDSTWSITFIPAEFYGVEEGTNVSAINCVFNAGDWSLGEGKDFDAEGNCTDFLIPLSGVGIGENSDINSFNLYPNPVENELNIENLKKDVNKIEIFTITGKKVKMVENISSAKIKLNISDLQSGLYFITLHSNNSVQTAKFIKN